MLPLCGRSQIGKAIKCPHDAFLLQEDLDRLVDWCQRNGLALNIDKCKYIRFSRSTHLNSQTYSINNKTLEVVTTIRDLGVDLDRKINFHTHIDRITTKSFQMLGFIIRNTRDFKKPQTKIRLFEALVRSGLEYGAQVWSPHYEVHIKRLERIQKRFLWHLSYQCNKAKKLPTYQSRLEYFKLHSLINRRHLLDQVLLYKLVNGNLDCPGLVERITVNVPLKLPRASRYTPFTIKTSKTNLGRNATVNRLLSQYNKLAKVCDIDIDIFSDSLPKFKRKITASFTSLPRK